MAAISEGSPEAATPGAAAAAADDGEADSPAGAKAAEDGNGRTEALNQDEEAPGDEHYLPPPARAYTSHAMARTRQGGARR